MSFDNVISSLKRVRGRDKPNRNACTQSEEERERGVGREGAENGGRETTDRFNFINTDYSWVKGLNATLVPTKIHIHA